MPPLNRLHNDVTTTQQAAACIRDILNVNDDLFQENAECENKDQDSMKEEADDDCRSVSSESSTDVRRHV
jgi:hypothetical protein